VGYLLKDRVFNDEAFTAAIRTVAAGGTVLDPEVVQKLMTSRSRTEPVARLTPREREVLALMAEGRSKRGHRAAAFHHREGGEQARGGHLRPAGPGAFGRRQPARPGRPGLS
jgi:hypothetical protein